MIHTTPYVIPTKNRIADYKRICNRQECIVSVIKRGDWFMVKRYWVNQFGGGKSDYHLLRQDDNSFTHPGQFVISIADWTAVMKRSLNHTKATAKLDIHEWKSDYEGGPLKYRAIPKAKLGDVLTIIRPHDEVLGAVKVRSKQNDEFVVYLSQLQCADDTSTTPSGVLSAT